MEIDFERELTQAVRSGFAKAVAEVLGRGYDNPVTPHIKAAIDTHAPKMQALLVEAIGDSLGTEEFRQQIRESVRHKLASLLVQRFGGELEKQVNVLKSDPATRARITLAIEEICKA